MGPTRKLVLTLTLALVVLATGLVAVYSFRGPQPGEAAAAAASSPAPASSSTAEASPAPSPPDWLLAEARSLAESPEDIDPDAVRIDAIYWGTPHDPELGDLTASGPDDPSTWAYVLVFVGDFRESLHSRPVAPGETLDPQRIGWRLYIFDDVTHELGVYGEGQSPFDFSAYPSLHRLEL